MHTCLSSCMGSKTPFEGRLDVLRCWVDVNLCVSADSSLTPVMALFPGPNVQVLKCAPNLQRVLVK
jgi:hypothetical protein